MKKVILFYFSLFLSFNCFCQCNTNVLKNRPYYHFKSNSDKIENIGFSALNDKAILQEFNVNITEMKKYIHKSIESVNRPNIYKYIKWIDDLRLKSFPLSKIDETENLDEMVYCYLNFIKTKYLKISSACKSINKIGDLVDRLSVIYDEIEKESTPQLNQIVAEMNRLKDKYSDK